MATNEKNEEKGGRMRAREKEDGDNRRARDEEK